MTQPDFHRKSLSYSVKFTDLTVLPQFDFRKDLESYTKNKMVLSIKHNESKSEDDSSSEDSVSDSSDVSSESSESSLSSVSSLSSLSSVSSFSSTSSRFAKCPKSSVSSVSSFSSTSSESSDSSPSPESSELVSEDLSTKEVEENPCLVQALSGIPLTSGPKPPVPSRAGIDQLLQTGTSPARSTSPILKRMDSGRESILTSDLERKDLSSIVNYDLRPKRKFSRGIAVTSIEKEDFFVPEIEVEEEQVEPEESPKEEEPKTDEVLPSYHEPIEPFINRRNSRRKISFNKSLLSLSDTYLKVKELEEQVTKMDAMILEVQTKMQTSGLDKGSLHISKLQDIVQDAKEHILELNKLFDEDHHND